VEVAKRAAGIAAERTDCVYVSFDSDVMDTAYVPGTGGVVIGGMTPRQMWDVLGVLREANVGAIDLMEVSPVLDPSGRSMRLAAELITHFIAPRIFDRDVISRTGPDRVTGRQEAGGST